MRLLWPVYFALLVLVIPAGAPAQERLAIKGYDTVAYFTEGKPVPGKSEIQHRWQGSSWYFASTANRDAFAKDPDKYAPQYAGYCALGIAMGQKVEVDPKVWTIVEGKLYLNYDAKFGEQWRQNAVANIREADQKWPNLK